MAVRCEHLENGTGVRRIRRGYADSKAKPRFDVTEGSIGVILPVLDVSPALDGDEERALRATPNHHSRATHIEWE